MSCPYFFPLQVVAWMIRIHVLMCRNIFLSFVNVCLSAVHAFRDEATQRVCLEIIRKILPRLTPPQLQEILGAVTSFVSHPSPVCRERMYDILMWIQDNYRCA